MAVQFRLLPKPPDTFIGREEEIRKLEATLLERRIIFLEGLPGSGKTSLALALANSLEEKRPGKVFWIPCQEGWQADSLAGEVIHWLSEEPRKSLEGWEKENLPGIQERFLYLIFLLNHEGAVVFIDDLHLLESRYLPELLKLLQTYLRNARFFFISRERPPLPPMEMLDIFEERLEGLREEHALSLLESLLKLHGRSPSSYLEELRRVVKRLEGNPLLIRTSAALILEGLVDPKEMLRSLPEVFQEIESSLLSRILEGLGSPEQEVLEFLSVATVPLPRDVVGDQKLREQLERRFLLSRDEKGRIFVHSLIREFIVKGMKEERRESLHLRLARYFHDLFGKNQGGLEPARHALYHYSQAGRFAEIEALLLESGGRLCSQGYYEEVLRLLSLLPSPDPRLLLTKAHVLSILGRWKESIEILEGMRETIKGKELQGELYSSLAGAYLNTGNLARSLTFYEEALKLFRETSNPRGIVKALNYMTFIYAFRSQVTKAAECSDEALELIKELQDLPGLAHWHRMRGTLLLESGRCQEALEISQECLSKAKSISSVRLTCWALFNMGSALLGLGQLEEGRGCFEDSLRRGEDSLDTQIAAFSYLGLTRVSLEEEDIEAALQHVQEAMKNFRSQGNSLGESVGRYLMAVLCLEGGKEKEALRILQEVLDVASSSHHFSLEVRARELLAWLALSRGEYSEAAQMAEKNLEVLTTIQREESFCEGYLLLAEAAFRTRNPRVGEYLKRCEEVARKGGLDYHLARLLYLSGKISGDSAEVKTRRLEEARRIVEGLKGSQRRLAERYCSRIERVTEKKYFVKTRDREALLQEGEVASLRKRMEEFSLFVDVAGKRVWEKSRGEVNLLGKPILSSLLLLLVKHAGKGFTDEEIFPKVWGFPYDNVTSGNEVRKNISRLRNLLEPDRKSNQYIKLAEGLLKEKGRYLFNPTENYCLIEEVTE